MVAVRLLAHDNQFADGDQLLTPLGQRRREIVAHRYLNGGWWYAVQTGYGRKWYSEAVLVECNPGNILVFESVDKTIRNATRTRPSPDVELPPLTPSDLWEFDASAPETPVCGEAGLPVKAQPPSPDYLKLDGVLKNAANGAGYANRRDQVQAALDMLMTEWGRLRVVDDRWRAFERAEIELTQALVFAAHPSRANGLAACAACSRAAFELRGVGK